VQVKETGIILFCEHYRTTLAFYVSKLRLQVRQEKEGLTILEFGGNYLMIETNGVSSDHEKTRAQNPTVLRFDVENMDEAVNGLRDRGVSVDVRKFDWGTIGVIIDPEGNRIELKD
jgi:lactoylglutathione lyase